LVLQGLASLSSASEEENWLGKNFYGSAIMVESNLEPEALQGYVNICSPDYSFAWRKAGTTIAQSHWGFEMGDLLNVILSLKLLSDLPADWPEMKIVVDEETVLVISPEYYPPLKFVERREKFLRGEELNWSFYGLGAGAYALWLRKPPNSASVGYVDFMKHLIAPYKGNISGESYTAVPIGWFMAWVELGNGRYLYIFSPRHFRLAREVTMSIDAGEGWHHYDLVADQREVP